MKFKDYRWIIIVSFFVLSIINIWFGLLGFICMGLPILQAARGKGKIHCKTHCPRGSFFQKLIARISIRNSLPKFMLTDKFRHILLVLMITMLIVSIIHSAGNLQKVAFGVFRLMGISFIFGIVLGIYYKPKSWCAICPMGHATNLISKLNTKTDNRSEQKKSA